KNVYLNILEEFYFQCALLFHHLLNLHIILNYKTAMSRDLFFRVFQKRLFWFHFFFVLGYTFYSLINAKNFSAFFSISGSLLAISIILPSSFFDFILEKNSFGSVINFSSESSNSE